MPQGTAKYFIYRSEQETKVKKSFKIRLINLVEGLAKKEKGKC